MRLFIAAAVLAVASAALCAASQSPENDIFTCARVSTWRSDNLGPHAPRCAHVYNSIPALAHLRRSSPPDVFAQAAWVWIDDTAACVFAIKQELTRPLHDDMLSILISHHKIVLRNVLISDKAPLRPPKDACAPYVTEAGSLKRLQVQGIKVHPKVAVKVFDRADPSNASAPLFKMRGLVAKSDIKTGARACSLIAFYRFLIVS